MYRSAARPRSRPGRPVCRLGGEAVGSAARGAAQVSLARGRRGEPGGRASPANGFGAPAVAVVTASLHVIGLTQLARCSPQLARCSLCGGQTANEDLSVFFAAGRDGATARPSSAARRTQKAGEVAARHAVRGRAGEGHRPRSSGRPRGGRGRVRTMRRYGARSTASHLVPRLSHLVSLRPRLVLGVDVTLVNVGNTSWLAHCPRLRGNAARRAFLKT